MKEIEELTSLDTIEAFIRDHQLSFIYISRPTCGVCHAVLPQLREMLMQFPLIRLGRINAENVEEIAAKFLTFSVPSLLLFIDGKEYLRMDRFVYFEQLKEKINKIYEMYIG